MAQVQHIDIPESGLHEPKGISLAAANTVYVANGNGSGSFQSFTRSVQNEVVISGIGDLPVAVGDIITLEASTIYTFDASINLSSQRFVLGSNTVVRASDPGLVTLTSTTTGALFTSASSFHLSNIKVTVTSGSVFSCTGGAYESAWIENFTINSCTTVGTFTDWYSLYWNSGAVVSSTNALTLAGTCTILILDLVEWITGYTTGIDLGTATFNTCTFNRCGFGYSSATNHIIVAANSANINAGYEGRINDCTFNASATNIVANYLAGDTQWEARHNLNLESTTKNAQGYMHTTTTTTISGGDGDNGNPKVVNGGANWVASHEDQFTISTGGRFTYDGITTAEFLVTCSISGTTSSGSGQVVNHYLAKNGTVITASKTQREYASTAIGSPAPANTIVELEEGDYLELYLENTSSTNNWDSEILNMVIGQVA